jgi:hypothetical protein
MRDDLELRRAAEDAERVKGRMLLTMQAIGRIDGKVSAANKAAINQAHRAVASRLKAQRQALLNAAPVFSGMNLRGTGAAELPSEGSRLYKQYEREKAVAEAQAAADAADLYAEGKIDPRSAYRDPYGSDPIGSVVGLEGPSEEAPPYLTKELAEALRTAYVEKKKDEFDREWAAKHVESAPRGAPRKSLDEAFLENKRDAPGPASALANALENGWIRHDPQLVARLRYILGAAQLAGEAGPGGEPVRGMELSQDDPNMKVGQLHLFKAYGVLKEVFKQSKNVEIKQLAGRALSMLAAYKDKRGSNPVLKAYNLYQGIDAGYITGILTTKLEEFQAKTPLVIRDRLEQAMIAVSLAPQGKATEVYRAKVQPIIDAFTDGGRKNLLTAIGERYAKSVDKWRVDLLEEGLTGVLLDEGFFGYRLPANLPKLVPEPSGAVPSPVPQPAAGGGAPTTMPAGS